MVSRDRGDDACFAATPLGRLSAVDATAFNQHGIAELMRAVAVLREGSGDSVQRHVVGDGPEEFEVAFARFVHASKDRVHDAQPGFTRDASTRNAVSGAQPAVGVRGGLERPDDGCPDRDDAPAFCLRLLDSCTVRLGMR